ncbi:MAG: PAS domain-containing protein, partial [Quisquiliibacterium sp.]
MTETGIGSQTFLNRVRIGHWLVPLAVAVSAGLAVLVLVGTLPVLQALLAGASTWTMAGLALAATLRRRDHRSKDDRERLSTLEDLHARFGIAEHLGAFGTFLIERTARSPVWSAGAFRLFGSDSNGIEPTLREFTEAIHPQDRRLWIDLHRKAMREGGEAKLEYRFLRDGGEPIWIRSIARAESGRAGRIERLAGVAQVITSMRALRQQLAESEAKFRDLTNMSSDWVWETDQDSRWSFLSDGAEALFGPWIASLIGRRLWDLQDNEAAFGRPDWRAQRALMTSRAPFEDFEYALVSPDRKPYFIALSGRPAFGPDKEFVGYRGVGRDISREVQQRMLLRFESDLAALIRERSDPEQVVTAIIGKVCSSMGWVGGVNIAPIRKRRSFTVRERAGDKRFMRMVSQLPSEFTL